MHYQIYFRISRGGNGIPYELAKTEFLTVFREFVIEIKHDWWGRRRMWIDLSLPPDKVAVIASDLGYTEAILHLRYEPYRGEKICPTERGRWYVGWIRQQDLKVHQTEVFIQDAESLLEDGPNQRTFEIQQVGIRRVAFGHRAHRALSSVDARFLFNIANARSTNLILDPFAGYGGLVSEAKRRGLRITASDVDKILSLGLSALQPEACSIADARYLPFRANYFDLIVTEPPFRTTYRQDVIDSLPELRRVLRPQGRLILLISTNMYEGIQNSLGKMGADVKLIDTVPRGGGLKCPALEIKFLK